MQAFSTETDLNFIFMLKYLSHNKVTSAGRILQWKAQKVCKLCAQRSVLESAATLQKTNSRVEICQQHRANTFWMAFGFVVSLFDSRAPMRSASSYENY